MRYSDNSPSTAVYAPNSYSGPHADEARYGNPAGWDSSGPQVRAAYDKDAEDGDFVQPGTLYREVLSQDARDRLVANIAGHVSDGVVEPVLSRVFEHRTNVDAELGTMVEEAVRSLQAEADNR